MKIQVTGKNQLRSGCPGHAGASVHVGGLIKERSAKISIVGLESHVVQDVPNMRLQIVSQTTASALSTNSRAFSEGSFLPVVSMSGLCLVYVCSALSV